MLVDTENTSDQFITRLAVDMDIHEVGYWELIGTSGLALEQLVLEL